MEIGEIKRSLFNSKKNNAINQLNIRLQVLGFAHVCIMKNIFKVSPKISKIGYIFHGQKKL